MSTALISGILKVGNMVLSFAVVVLLVRTLGADGYGVYTLAFVFCSILSILVEFGLPNFTLRETATANQNKDWLRMKTVWRWSYSRAAFLSVGIGLLAAVAIYIYFSGFSHEGAATALISLLLLPLLAFDNLKSAALRGLGHITVGQLSAMLVRPSIFLLMTFLVVLSSWQIDPFAMMFLRVVSAALALWFVVYFLNKHLPMQIKSQGSDGLYEKSWMMVAASMAVTAAMTQITNYADLVILGFYMPAADVGFYRVAVQVSTLVIFGARAVAMVSAPRFAKARGVDQRLKLQRLASVTSRLSFFAAAISGLFLLGSGEKFLTIVFGAEYAAAYTTMVVLVIGQLINAMFGPVATIMAMVGLERTAAKAMIYSALINICLNLILIPEFGIFGASISTLACFGFWNIWMWWNLNLKMGIRCDPFA